MAIHDIIMAAAGASGSMIYVGGVTGSFAGTGTFTVSLTGLTGGFASSPANNDIIVAASTTTSGGVPTITGYTQIAAVNSGSGGSSSSNLRVAYKISNGSDTSVNFGSTGGGTANLAKAAAVHVWRFVDTTTPIDVTTQTASNTGSTRADPPAITPVTFKAIIIAVGAGSSDSGGYTAPSNLGNFIADTNSTSTGARIGMGSAVWTSGASFDPGLFGGSNGSSAGGWTAATLALRPKK